MSRVSRKFSSTRIYHVVLRGVNRQNIFEEPEDKTVFFNIMKKLKRETLFALYGYCLMDNHVHLLIKEGQQNISKIIQRLNISYAMWFNHKYDRCGHLFQGRFKSEPVESQAYFFTVLRYIHQNPVKAKISDTITDFDWSSIHDYLGKYGIVDTGLALKFFANSTESFMVFMKFNEETECLDIDAPRWLSDRKAYSLIMEHIGITSPFEIQTFPTTLRNKLIKKIFDISGISCRQIARITGLSLSVVFREKPTRILCCT